MTRSKFPVVWITGLAGAGKTTLAAQVVRELRVHNANVVHVDGDVVRELFGGDLTHSTADRLKNAFNICRLCSFLQRQGQLVVCSTISMFPEVWHWNRKHLSPYVQVYLKVGAGVLQARDKKGLYSGSKSGMACDVVGCDLPFSEPLDSDLVLVNDLLEQTHGNLRAILERIAANKSAES